jgi:predicted GNAT family N-acyltransferase
MIKINTIKNSDSNLDEINRFSTDNWGESSQSPEEEALNYFTPADYIIEATDKKSLVGLLMIKIRKDATLNNKQIKLGSIGGVVVDKKYRHRGIATLLLKKAMELLHTEEMDIAILCTRIDVLGKLYAKVGFVVLNHDYTFINKNGIITNQPNGMIANINNRSVFDIALNRESKLFMGESDF